MRLRSSALGYAEHGWDVLPGAYLARGRFCCGTGCRTVACHPARPDLVSHDPDVVGGWWSRRPFSVLLPTGLTFDVLEVSACPGAGIAQAAGGGPVAVTPAGHWMILVGPGSRLCPELAGRTDVVLHGRGSWVPAPPTREPGGRVRWVVSPTEAQWRLPDPGRVQTCLADLLPALGLPPPRRVRVAA
ncbi:bifunctional DNA primase/polymerase [Rugosimonospora acidiphila]|uniref:Bifunctional DNA primase/polymerase n=1 Tax=Rugosimonospora acidiphila TaxID=556531 RepID=A0ABP9RSC7_9ACTN